MVLPGGWFFLESVFLILIFEGVERKWKTQLEHEKEIKRPWVKILLLGLILIKWVRRKVVKIKIACRKIEKTILAKKLKSHDQKATVIEKDKSVITILKYSPRSYRNVREKKNRQRDLKKFQRFSKSEPIMKKKQSRRRSYCDHKNHQDLKNHDWEKVTTKSKSELSIIKNPTEILKILKKPHPYA